ncbi:MAG: cytochrome c [Anaerolineaceae bacterium]|nr:cytochrome c [Anaerolineaceae bacterium]
MKKQSVVIVMIMIFIIILSITGCGPTVTPTPTETPIVVEIAEVHKGQSLMNSYCVSCHVLGVVEKTRYDLDGWQACMERMVLFGTKLNPEQQAMIIEYLSLTFPEEG